MEGGKDDMDSDVAYDLAKKGYERKREIRQRDKC